MSIRGRTRCSSAIGFWCPLPSGRDHFLLCHRHCIQEGLHRGFAGAPTSLMLPCLIVFFDPRVQIGLQLVDCTISLFAEPNTIELLVRALVEALPEPVRLPALDLGA